MRIRLGANLMTCACDGVVEMRDQWLRVFFFVANLAQGRPRPRTPTPAPTPAPTPCTRWTSRRIATMRWFILFGCSWQRFASSSSWGLLRASSGVSSWHSRPQALHTGLHATGPGSRVTCEQDRDPEVHRPALRRRTRCQRTGRPQALHTGLHAAAPQKPLRRHRFKKGGPCPCHTLMMFCTPKSTRRLRTHPSHHDQRGMRLPIRWQRSSTRPAPGVFMTSATS